MSNINSHATFTQLKKSFICNARTFPLFRQDNLDNVPSKHKSALQENVLLNYNIIKFSHKMKRP